MIDLKYHIASIVAVFLALGLGILIGTTIVGDDIFIEQQKKLLERLEEQFGLFKDREAQLVEDNNFKDDVISNYENYTQALLPFLVDNRLKDERVAIVVTGNTDIPSGLINTISLAGAQVASKTVILSNIDLINDEIRAKLISYYNIQESADTKETNEILRSYIASSVAAVLLNEENAGIIEFMQENELVNFNGDFAAPVNGFIILGGTNNSDADFASSFDRSLIQHLTNSGIKIFGVERSNVEYSYMPEYQQYNITTIDNIDISPGQISLVFAMVGESGNYGIKPTAQKFMPSLPLQSLGSETR